VIATAEVAEAILTRLALTIVTATRDALAAPAPELEPIDAVLTRRN
jgi:hypothetical protein